jgi:energy-converting hydrogenase Eha subunit G
MRKPLLILGILLVVAGILVAAGQMKYQDKDKVVDLGNLELEASREKTAPVNWGWILLGGGAVLLIGGALVRKT